MSRYVKIDLANLPEFGKGKTCEYRGIAVQCGPRGLPGEADFLFRNEGDRRLHRGGRGRGRARTRAATSAWASPGSTTTTTAGPTSTWRTTPRPASSTPNQKNGTFKEVGFPHGRGGERGRRRAGRHGPGRSATTTAAGASASSRRTSPRSTTTSTATRVTTSRSVAFRSKTGPPQPALRGLGHRFPRLRQRRRGSTSSRSTATSIRRSTRRKLGASAGYRQRKLLYHNLGDGTFEEVGARFGTGAHRAAREPRPGRGRPGRRRAPRRR